MSVRYRLRFVALTFGGIALLLASGCVGTRSAAPPSETAEREVLLTVPDRSAAAIALTGPPQSRYLRRRGYGAATPEVERILDALAREHGLQRKEGWPIRSLAVYCEVFVVPEEHDIADVLERLAADPRVDLAQRMNLFETLGYDDPYADLQPAALALGIEQAHRVATGKGVRVVLVDSAVDAGHPDLDDRVSVVRDLVEPGRRPAAELHGTAIAGVIASTANNREGIFGIAPDVELASLRACWSEPDGSARARCTSFTLARALEIAIDLEPELINLSLAGPTDPLLERLLDEAVARGILVVSAEPPATREGAFPSSHPKVLAARAASAGAGSPALPAPADEILTTTPGAGYAFFSGTSLAAAHLTGVIALLLERVPSFDAAAVASVLRRSIVRTPGHESVHACYALQAAADERVCEPAVAGVSADRGRSSR